MASTDIPQTQNREQRAEQERQWKAHALYRYLTGLREDYATRRDGMIADLQKDHGLYWSSAQAFEVATAKFKVVARYWPADGGDLDPEAAAARGERARLVVEELKERVLRAARGAHNSGDLNSTGAFSRFAAAAELSAYAEMVEDLQRFL